MATKGIGIELAKTITERKAAYLQLAAQIGLQVRELRIVGKGTSSPVSALREEGWKAEGAMEALEFVLTYLREAGLA